MNYLASEIIVLVLFYLISKRSNTIIISGDLPLISEKNEFVLDTKKLKFLQLNDSCLESTFSKRLEDCLQLIH